MLSTTFLHSYHLFLFLFIGGSEHHVIFHTHTSPQSVLLTSLIRLHFAFYSLNDFFRPIIYFGYDHFSFQLFYSLNAYPNSSIPISFYPSGASFSALRIAYLKFSHSVILMFLLIALWRFFLSCNCYTSRKSWYPASEARFSHWVPHNLLQLFISRTMYSLDGFMSTKCVCNFKAGAVIAQSV
jgi:hypothetical protein